MTTIKHVLVINSGSSSIKFSMFVLDSAAVSSGPQLAFAGEVSDVGEETANVTVDSRNAIISSRTNQPVQATTQSEAIHIIFDMLGGPGMPCIDAIGYRVVHPGAKLMGHQRITPTVLDALNKAVALAPLHDPSEIELIHQGLNRYPQTTQYACFDTEFHRTMPEEATTYAIPIRYRDCGVRRYGFHGLSCESIVKQMRSGGTKMPRRVVIAHLGSGCSVTAVLNGASIDTTMGMTPTGGVVMGTRPGDLDPGTLLYLLRQQAGDGLHAASTLETMLDQECGLVALSGLPNDMRTVTKAAADGDARAVLALNVFSRSITKAIGSFCWLMGGLDAVVFTGGIGEHVPFLRARILDGLDDLDIAIDPSLNEANETGLRRIERHDSIVRVFVIPAEEDLMIAIHVSELMHLDQRAKTA